LSANSTEIEEWLQRTGYPLEMRVAKEFRTKRPAFVEQSYFYHDVATGEVREGDVLASWSTSPGDWLQLLFAVECKSSGVPWVVFTEGRERLEPLDFRRWLDATPSIGLSAKRIVELGARIKRFPIPLLTMSKSPGYGIVEKKDEGKQRGGGASLAYDAVRQAASFALGIAGRANSGDAEVSNGEEPDYTSIIFPIVVTKSPIFECWLNSDNLPTARQVDSSSVVVYLGKPARHVVVTVVNDNNIAQLADACLRTATALSERA